MRRTVFYSWQSDLAGARNRSLIEDCLKRAIRSIGRDEDAWVEPVLDRDTVNLAGAPDIAHSIFAKIELSDAFVADVSIISVGETRPTPNPNVLIELGYAVAKLGWDKIILVQNSVYGGPEMLPFDLRGRRIVAYEFGEQTNRAEVRGLLQGRLEAGLRAALGAGPATGLPSGRDSNIWWGRWSVDHTPTAGGSLFIREVGPSGFLFDLDVYNGAHSGSVTAYARIVSDDVAYCRLPNGGFDDDGELMFRRRITNGSRELEIVETAPCTHHRGMRAYFGGRFKREYEPWFDSGFMNEIEVARLYLMTGLYLDKMRRCTDDIGELENLDVEINARVVFGGVAGLYTIMESIVMFTESGDMWAAFIDEEIVRYFTNVSGHRNMRPKTIESWREKFSDKIVEYCEAEMVVPRRDI